MPDRNPPDPGGPLRRITPDGRGHRLCAGHDGLRPGRRGLEGARRQEDGAGARQHRHPEPRAFACRACRAHHPIGRYRDGRNGRPAEIPRSRCRSGSTDTWPRRSNSLPQIARDRRARCRWQLAVFVVAGNTPPQHRRPGYFTYHRETPGQHASHQRAAAVAPDRTIHDHPVEAHHQAGRQLRRRPHRRDRQRLLQQLLPDIPARPRRQHQPDAERRRRPDPLAGVGQEHGSFQNRPVLQASEAELGRILQDHLPVRRHREVFRLRGNAAFPDGRHRGDVGRLAAVRLAGRRCAPTPSSPAFCCA